MASFEHVLPEDVAEADLLALIARLNRDPLCTASSCNCRCRKR